MNEQAFCNIFSQISQISQNSQKLGKYLLKIVNKQPQSDASSRISCLNAFASLNSNLLYQIFPERDQVATAGLRADKMEAPKGLAENRDQVDRVHHQNGAVAQFAEED